MLTIEMKIEFLNLACALSPENLTCDGELSQAQVRKRHKEIISEWRALEKKAGYSVHEDEPYKWNDEIRAHDAKKRAEQLAAMPQHPSLTAANPGVWSKYKPNSTNSLYYIHKREASTLKIGGRKFEQPADDKFKLFCNAAHRLDGKELLGVYDTLEECVGVGDAYIASLTMDAMRAKLPLYTEENLIREFKYLTGG